MLFALFCLKVDKQQCFWTDPNTYAIVLAFFQSPKSSLVTLFYNFQNQNKKEKRTAFAFLVKRQWDKKERGGLGCARKLEPFSMSASEAVNSATTPSTAGTVSGVKSANSLQTSNQSPQVSWLFIVNFVLVK